MYLGMKNIGAQTLVVKASGGVVIHGVKAYSSLENSRDTSIDAPTSNERGIINISSLKGSQNIHFVHPSYSTLVTDYASLKTGDTLVMHFNYVIKPTTFQGNRRFRLVSQPSTTLDRKHILLSNPATSADLLNSEGKIFIQKSQLGGGSPMIRGFSANRLLLVVDGVRMNNAIYRGGNVQNVLSVDANSVNEVEVIFGPGSVIYGSDALGGVMNFRTLNPKFGYDEVVDVKGNVFSRYASASGEKTGHFDMNIASSNLASVTSFSFSSFDDLKMGKNGRDEYLRKDYADRFAGNDVIIPNPDPRVQIGSGFEMYNLIQKISYLAAEDLEIDYGFYYSTTSDIPRYDRLIQEENGSLRYSEWHYGPQKWVMNRFGVSYGKSNGMFDNMNVVLAFQDYEESRISRNFGNNWRNLRSENVTVTSFNLDFQKKLDSTSQLYYGAELVSNLVGSEGNNVHISSGKTSRIPSRYPDNSTWNSEAIYGSYIKELKNLTLLAGARLNLVQIEAPFDTTVFKFPFTEASNSMVNVNGNLGAVFNVSKKIKIQANLSSGFRAPNIDDIGKIFDSQPGTVIVPNPDLKPELAYNADLGITKIIPKICKIEVTGFYTYLNHAIVPAEGSFNGNDSILYDGVMSEVFTLSNTESAVIYGLQFSAEFRLKKRVYLGLTYNHMEGETSKNEPLRHITPDFGKVYLKYKKSNILAEANVIYNGEMKTSDLAITEANKPHLYALDENGNPFSPTWYTVNFKGSYKFQKWLTVSAGVENILNERYRPYSSGITAPGTNFILSVSSKF
jgi:hemoglobin/transferrin/lactoferrin receptor protein